MKTLVKQHFYGYDVWCRSMNIPCFKDVCSCSDCNETEKTFCSDNTELTDISRHSSDKLQSSSVNQSETQSSRKALPGKPVVFLIHGVGGSACVFEQQREYFRERGFEVVIPELLGHGFSPEVSQKSAYFFDELMLDIFIIFDMFCKGQNIVIGHSYG